MSLSAGSAEKSIWLGILDNQRAFRYVNKCGFHIVEFFNRFHPDPHDTETGMEATYDEGGGMFRFEKRIGGQ